MKKISILLFSISLLSLKTTISQTFTIESEDVCFGKQSTLVANQSIVHDSLVSAYKWDLDADGQYDDATTQTNTLIYLFSDSAGTYPVSAMIEKKDLSKDTMETPANIIIKPIPEADFYVENLCEWTSTRFVDSAGALVAIQVLASFFKVLTSSTLTFMLNDLSTSDTLLLAIV